MGPKYLLYTYMEPLGKDMCHPCSSFIRFNSAVNQFWELKALDGRFFWGVRGGGGGLESMF